MSRPNALAGIALAIAACACFSTLDTTTKYVSAAVPLLMALWFRYAFQAVVTTVAVMPTRGLKVWHTRRLPLQLLRGLLLLASSLSAFTSLRYMPVGEFTAIVMISPLFITLLAATVLREHVSALRWTLVAGGFAGALLIIRPGGEAFTAASLLPLCVVLSNALFHMVTTQLARTDDPVTTHLYTGWVGTVVAGFTLPFVWQWLPEWRLWALLCFMGAAAAIGHYFLILAYRHAPASTLTPFMYSQIGFGMLGGFIIFGHVPDAYSIGGILLIAACGAASAWLTVRERG